MKSIGFNEGKACDAVIRYLEHREATSRRNCRNPQHEGHHAPIDFACHIGETLFALEHTGIEPFEKYLEFQTHNRFYVDPIMDELAGILPQDVFRLTIRINLQSLRDLKLRRKNQAALSQWIKKTAPELKITPEGRGGVRRIDWTSIEDFPFQVSLRRYEPVVKPYFIINYFIDDDIEKARLPRIHRACAEHFGKLAVWQQEAKARTVLILEDNDLSLTNEHLVIEALASVEESIPNPPDEMYLVNTEIDSMWHMRCLRDGSKRYYELNEIEYMSTTNPQDLVNITGR